VRGDQVYLLDDEEYRVVKFFFKPKMFQDKPAVTFGGEGENNGKLQKPVDFDLNGDGDVAILDGERCNVQVFDPSGRFMLSIGSMGTGPGQLKKPVALAYGSKGQLYVLDDIRKKILLFENYRFRGEFDCGGKTETLVDLKVDLFTGRVYVLESALGRVKRYDADGRFLGDFGKKGGGFGQFQKASRLRIDGMKTLYVIDGEGERLYRFSEEGQVLGRWGGYGFRKCERIAASRQGELALLDTSSYLVTRLDQDGWIIAQFGGSGSAMGKFEEAVDIAVDGAGFIYVLDQDAGRISKFTPEGKLVIAFGKAGSGRTQLYDPIDLTITGERLAVLQDRDQYQIHLWDLKGKSLGAFPAKEDVIEGPRCVFIDTRGYTHAVQKNGRIVSFKAGGLQAGSKWKAGFDSITDVAVSDVGFMYFLDNGAGLVHVLDKDRTAFPKIQDKKRCSKPWDLAIDAFDGVYVFDDSNDRIVKFGR
jgi:hypothetical protein